MTYNGCVRLCVLEQEQECSELADHASSVYVLKVECISVLKNNKKTERLEPINDPHTPYVHHPHTFIQLNMQNGNLVNVSWTKLQF